MLRACKGTEARSDARPSVSVLFARKHSIYHSLDCDVWDEARDARLYLGRSPVVAHPPCRSWGRLRHRSKHPPHEPDLARFAVRTVQLCGGVLEHPAASRLWPDMGLPLPRSGRDAFGGHTIEIFQSDFGHPAPKRTWLYLVGCAFPLYWRETLPFGRVENLSRASREATPRELALALLETARRARAPISEPQIFGNGGAREHTLLNRVPFSGPDFGGPKS